MILSLEDGRIDTGDDISNLAVRIAGIVTKLFVASRLLQLAFRQHNESTAQIHGGFDLNEQKCLALAASTDIHAGHDLFTACLFKKTFFGKGCVFLRDDLQSAAEQGAQLLAHLRHAGNQQFLSQVSPPTPAAYLIQKPLELLWFPPPDQRGQRAELYQDCRGHYYPIAWQRSSHNTHHQQSAPLIRSPPCLEQRPPAPSELSAHSVDTVLQRRR